MSADSDDEENYQAGFEFSAPLRKRIFDLAAQAQGIGDEPGDRLEDFDSVYAFDHAFDECYVWQGARELGN